MFMLVKQAYHAISIQVTVDKIATLGGAAMTVGNLSFFQDGMTVGRGFIAFAAVVFGRL